MKRTRYTINVYLTGYGWLEHRRLPLGTTETQAQEEIHQERMLNKDDTFQLEEHIYLVIHRVCSW